MEILKITKQQGVASAHCLAEWGVGMVFYGSSWLIKGKKRDDRGGEAKKGIWGNNISKHLFTKSNRSQSPMNPIVIVLENTLISLIQIKRSNELDIIFRSVSFKGCVRVHFRQCTAQFIADKSSTYIQIVLRENDMDLSHYKELKSKFVQKNKKIKN